MMRAVLLTMAITGFAGLGVLDLLTGSGRVGIAALFLAVANFLLLMEG